MNPLCPMDHGIDHDGQPRQRNLMDGLRTCTWHYDRAQRAVAELPGLYEFLGRQLAASTGAGLTGMPAAKRDPGLNLNPRSVGCRHDIRNGLASWAKVACDERGITPPADTVPAVATFILVQWDWYMAGPWTKQVVNDVIDWWATARGLADPNRTRSIHVCPCPEPGCDGMLVARLRPADDLLPAIIACDAEPVDEDGNRIHLWPPDKWMLLGRRVLRAVGQ